MNKKICVKMETKKFTPKNIALVSIIISMIGGMLLFLSNEGQRPVLYWAGWILFSVAPLTFFVGIFINARKRYLMKNDRS